MSGSKAAATSRRHRSSTGVLDSTVTPAAVAKLSPISCGGERVRSSGAHESRPTSSTKGIAREASSWVRYSPINLAR